MGSTKKAGSPVAKSTTSRGRRPGRPTIGNDELLSKALELFLEQGFERTSIDGIAAVAGVAKRTLYLRYKDKESLFRAAIQGAIADWVVPEEQLRAVECDDLEETLLEIGRVLLKKIMAPDSLRLIRLAKAESIRAPEISAFTYQLGTDRTVAYLADLFQRRIKRMVVEPNDWNEAATAFLYMVISGPPSMTAWGMPLSDEKLEYHIRHSVCVFLYGMLPRDEMKQQKAGVSRAVVSAQAGVQLPAMDYASAPMDASNFIELQNENRLLRKLLLDSMLEVGALKEQRENF